MKVSHLPKFLPNKGDCEKQVIIIIDEAQLLYSSINTRIWDWLKSNLAEADNLYFVFSAPYGEKVRDRMLGHVGFFCSHLKPR